MARQFDFSDFDVESGDENRPNPNGSPFPPTDTAAAAQVRANIASYASQSSELLATLASTEEAPSALAAQAVHLSRLQTTLSEAEAAHRSLADSVNANFKRHKRYRDSVTRKFYYRVTYMLPEFQARAKQESAAYFVALQEQSKSEEQLKNFRAQTEEAVEKKAELEAEAKRHGETHEKIDQLYESIFAGLTPGFPDEDEMEERFYAVRGRHEEVKATIIRAVKAGQFLAQATSVLSRARDLAKHARYDAEQSIFTFSTTYGLLSGSTNYISQTSSLVDRAIEVLGQLNTPMGDVKTDLDSLLQAARIQGENRFLDEDLVDRIVEAQETLSKANLKLDELARMVKGRERAGRHAIKTSARTLENVRQALQQRRELAFEETVGFGAAAPAYHECCDRADGFCQVHDPEPPSPLENDEEFSADGVQLPPYRDTP